MATEFKRFDVLNPVEGKDGKTYWTKVGVAFESVKGTLTGEIHQMPLNGRVVLRKAEKRNPETEKPPADD